MNQAEYWKNRWEQQEQRAHDAADTYMREIESIYREASRDLQGQINTWYARVADNNQVSMADARHLLNAKELKEFKWTVQDYIKAGKENGISADWSKQLENASARFHVSRLEAIKVELQNTIETLYGRELDVVDRMAKQTTLDSYLHAAFEIQKEAGVGWDVAGLNTKAIERIITKPWTTDGKNFSTRIWESKDKLINEVSRMMTQNLMTGGTVRDLVDKLSAKMDVSKTQAARLLYTESAYFQTQAQGESFKDLGVKQYIYIATLDDRTSDVCRGMDGQVFKMEDFQPGVTAPPLHPWCRSATAPYFADMVGLGERAARDPETGQTYYVPRSMKYDDWKNTFVDGGAKDGLTAIPQSVYNSTNPSGIRDLITNFAIKDDLKAVNPNYGKGYEWQNNCQRCCPTYEMRCRGKQVTALPVAFPEEYDVVQSNWRDIFKNAEWKKVEMSSGEKVESVLENVLRKNGDGTRVEIYVQWNTIGSHVFIGQNVKGSLKFVDPQNGEMNVTRYFDCIIPEKTEYCVISDLEPSDLIKECCK